MHIRNINHSKILRKIQLQEFTWWTTSCILMYYEFQLLLRTVHRNSYYCQWQFPIYNARVKNNNRLLIKAAQVLSSANPKAQLFQFTSRLNFVAVNVEMHWNATKHNAHTCWITVTCANRNLFFSYTISHRIVYSDDMDLNCKILL